MNPAAPNPIAPSMPSAEITRRNRAGLEFAWIMIFFDSSMIENETPPEFQSIIDPKPIAGQDSFYPDDSLAVGGHRPQGGPPRLHGGYRSNRTPTWLVRATPFDRTRRQQQQGRAWFSRRPKLWLFG